MTLTAKAPVKRLREKRRLRARFMKNDINLNLLGKRFSIFLGKGGASGTPGELIKRLLDHFVVGYAARRCRHVS